MIRRAFTLIELLTVMAITAILLTIIVVPLYQSFNLTRTAQAFADAQDRAHVLTERIAGEIGVATSVRSGEGIVLTTYRGVPAKLPSNSLIVEVPGKDGTTVEVDLPYSKIDITKPAEGESPYSGSYTNPSTGMIDPTMSGPAGQVDLPVLPGHTLTRFFMGRKYPFLNYNNPYDGQLMARNSLEDNLYVLYRAEVNPFETEVVGGIPRLKYFLEDGVDGGGNPNIKKPLLDDPRFFTPNRDIAGNIITTDDRARIINNWLGQGGNTVKRATIMTDFYRYDMIQAQSTQLANSVLFDGNFPRIQPLIQFRPARVSDEPAEGSVAARQGEESANSSAFAPSTYTTAHTLWDHALVRNWPKAWNPADSAMNAYNVGRGDARNGDPGQPPGMSIYVYDPDLGANDFDSGIETFDVFTYQSEVASGARYPFSDAAAAADSRSAWLSSQPARDTFVPFSVNPSKGRIETAFSVSEIGNNGANPPAFDPQNLPYMDTCGDGNAYTPFTDPDTTGNFYDAKFNSINEKFNKVWVDATNLQPNVHRFIDLRVTRNGDGTMGVLNPTSGFARASIVPGSDAVYGPDQMPGAHFGQPIRYTRTTRSPGPNQYRINYVDLPEPRDAGGAIDYSLLGLTPAQMAGFNPNVYDPNNFVSAVIQPRFKKGYVQLNSDPNVALPVGEILVSYQFQFNGAGSATGNREDVFSVDYDTRQLIDVVLTMRSYPQSSLPNPQSVTLKSTATVRNFAR